MALLRARSCHLFLPPAVTDVLSTTPHQCLLPRTEPSVGSIPSTRLAAHSSMLHEPYVDTTPGLQPLDARPPDVTSLPAAEAGRAAECSQSSPPRPLCLSFPLASLGAEPAAATPDPPSWDMQFPPRPRPRSSSRPCQGGVSTELARWLRSEPSRGGAAHGVVLLNAACALGLTQLQFRSLVEIEMMLFSAAHALFLVAFVALRVHRPDAHRPFRAPGGTLAAAAYSAAPLLICLATFGSNVVTLPHVDTASGVCRAIVCALVLGAALHVALMPSKECCSNGSPLRNDASGVDGPPQQRLA
mmetsp:Transcript_23396/g.71670  ORF Transcript_23396/g.71670 Transcript_23396/m.71670 type:complete len:301 (+) Transcript_23396:1222-2124(+)